MKWSLFLKWVRQKTHVHKVGVIIECDDAATLYECADPECRKLVVERHA